MVHPALLSELSHDGIYPGEAGPSLLPRPVVLLIVIPINLHKSRGWISLLCIPLSRGTFSNATRCIGIILNTSPIVSEKKHAILSGKHGQAERFWFQLLLLAIDKVD